MTVRDNYRELMMKSVMAKVFITGGTGSLGKAFLKRIVNDERVHEITVFSRDEAKQDFMRKEFVSEKIRYVIGDVRDGRRIADAVRWANPNCLVHAAALKQVPSCELAPFEAVCTNVEGAQNVADACNAIGVRKTVGISTDKACKPINAMGISKAMQEKLFIASKRDMDCDFSLVRYGNVLASRGSVIPFFHDRIRQGKTLPITGKDMTRFFLSLNRAVDTIMAAIEYGAHGEIFVPQAQSARIEMLAEVLIDENKYSSLAGKGEPSWGSPLDAKSKMEFVPIRPGEKIHEILISEEESKRLRCVNQDGGDCVKRGGGWYVIQPYDKAAKESNSIFKNNEFCSADFLMDPDQIRAMLSAEGLLHVE